MSEFIIPVPGRLKNVAVLGHVAGTEDIIDDALNKTLKQINSEADSKLQTVKGELLDDVASLDYKLDLEIENARDAESELSDRYRQIETLANLNLYQDPEDPENTVAVGTIESMRDTDQTADKTVPTVSAILGNVVFYTIEQNLTTAQQTRARNNIGAAKFQDLTEDEYESLSSEAKNNGDYYCIIEDE